MSALDRLPLHPALFAAYAVLYLYAANLDRVLPVDAAAPLAWAVLGAAALTLVLAVLFRNQRRGAIVATALVVAFFGYGHLASALAGVQPPDGALVAAWGVAIAAAIAYAIRAGASLPRVTAGLNVAALVLVVLAGIAIVPYEIGRAGRGPVAASTVIAAPGAVTRRPDIYFLIFDRYGSEEAIRRRFDLGNDLYGWLRGRGFEVPAHSHANYRATDFSLAATLNMQFLDNLTEQMGRVSNDRTPAQRMIADNEVGRFLKSQGYRFYQLGSWFEPTRTSAVADQVLVLGSTSEFVSVLRDTTIIPAVERALGVVNPEMTFRDRVRDGTLFELRQLRRLSTAPGPKFIFAHILLPHDPYTFRADGSVRTGEEEKATNERQLYADHLTFANAQIRDLVDYLLVGPEDSRPVVIIEGDEGPLACQNVDCVNNGSAEYLRIRLGNLVAMYLPGRDVELPDDFTSVNTFRTVLREYFGADLPPLPDRSFTWPDDDHIYDFSDVTDVIAGRGD